MDAKKILLIEDDHFINQLYLRVLKQAGFETVLASDGAEGVKMVNNSFNLILLDVMLPKIDGISVLKKLKENSSTKKIPVVLLTNLGQESVIKTAFEIGAQGYILKMSVTPYEMVKKIQEFIKNPSFQMNIKELDLD